MKEILLTGRNISKEFDGVKALKNIDFEIEKGKIICLAGENGCGKSTLVKILSGIHKPTTGQVKIGEKSYDYMTPIMAIEEGIQVIYQDLSLFPHLTVGENIAMNHMVYSKEKFVDKKKMEEIAREQIGKIGADLDINEPVRNLSIANKQLVAICRALSLEAKILFMDEPTTALTKKEVDRLLKVVLGLKDKGMSIVFISHKLNEVFEISDTITVIRDGEKIGDFNSNELDPKRLSYYMTGREVGYQEYKKDKKEKEKIIELKSLTREGMFENIDLSLEKGDILGITGLLGSGRTELGLSLFGLNKPTRGEIYFESKRVEIDSPRKAMDLGIALLPEDGLSQGLFLDSSEKFNITATILDKIKSKLAILDFKKEEKIAKYMVEKVNVNNKDLDLSVRSLSGGNQQKIVLAKWIATKPKVFILDTPTVGVDIGSKAEIYEKIQELAKNDRGVILISDEIEEILANCNKVLIMHEGKIIERLDEKDLASEDIEDRIFSTINNPSGGGSIER